MSLIKAFSTSPAPRPEPAVRKSAAPRRDDETDERDVRVRRKPTRAEFSALMALLAGAGKDVRAELLRQAPANGVSLLDKLLEDPAGESALSELVNASDSDTATDALRYGILKASQSTSGATDLSALQSALQQLDLNAAAASDQAQTRGMAEHARMNEVLGRIVGQRGLSVEQLKARGEEQAAEIRAALDALLAQAGTPEGLELAGASENASATAAENAALAAAATALAAAKAASAADVTTPVRDTAALAPELRERLDRVIDRMKNEYGHDVGIVETARSQERQDFLYEQGRTRPGSVVTWTRDSAHAHGDAVDVIIDGSWSNAAGFARLQRIAREEGLQTLGLRDPGHLELPSDAQRTMGAALAKAPPRAAQTDGPALPATAMQAGVARVAGVAGVAGVARVGDVGSARGLDRSFASTNAMSAAMAGASATSGDRGNGGASGRGAGDDMGRSSGDASNRESSTLGSARSEGVGSPAPSAFGALHTSTQITTPTTGEVPQPAAGAEAAARVADLQQLRDSTPAGSLSRVTLNVDAPGGGQDRITVDLRGNSVGTQISTDAANADRLRMRTAELQDALGRHGLDSESVRITGTARTDGDSLRSAMSDRESMRLNAAPPSASGDGANPQGQRERPASAREWDRPDPSRQSREEERESSRQGTGQRGQRGTYNGSAS